MIAAALVLASVASPSLFEVETLPLRTQAARVFLAPGRSETAPDIYVLDGYSLRAYPGGFAGEMRATAFPPGTSAVDVADVDGDGRAEVLAVHGPRILLFEPFEGDERNTPKVLFERENQLSESHILGPYCHVMAIEEVDRTLVALPCEEVFEIRTLDGVIVSKHPIEGAEAGAPHFGASFRVVPIIPPEAGGEGAIELRVQRTVAFEPDVRSDFLPAREAPRVAHRRATPLQARDAAGRAPAYWPWFSLRTNGESDDRVLYAVGGEASPGLSAGHAFTWVRVARFPAPDQAAPGGSEVGVRRKYPGILLETGTAAPDFNGDGFADLLLWNAPVPGASLDALSEALLAGTWPFRLSTHLYLPEKGRFAPRPQSHLACRIPIAWFLDPFQATPIRNVVQRDFDGDNRTDLGFSMAEDVFTVWLSGEEGFPAQPSFTTTFAGPVKEVVFCVDLAGKGRPTLALRSDRAVFLLRPSAVPARP